MSASRIAPTVGENPRTAPPGPDAEGPAPRLPAWVAAVDLACAPADPGRLVAALDPVGPRHRSARLLLTRGEVPLGTVDVDVVEGRVALDGLPAPAAPAAPAPAPSPTPFPAVADEPRGALPRTVVAVATRDRPDQVRVLLQRWRSMPGEATLLVVDNGPSDDRTRDVVTAASAADPRLRYVRDPVGGLSRARNRALAEAHADGAEVVAFVDDDVTMRSGWLAAVRSALADAPSVSCVTGPVLAGTLETPAQLASDAALGWTVGLVPRRFALDAPSANPLFPFAPGEYGVGANFAVRTADALAVGGFDELLGAGSPCRGGEDIEFWVRLVARGATLAYVPATWVWHHHRDSDEALRLQLAGYARGLGGYLAAVACDRGMRRLALRRAPRALAHVARLRGRERRAGVSRAEGGFAPVAVLRGAVAYLRGRRGGSVRRSRRTGS